MNRYFILNKPRGIVSQFVSTDPVGLLGDLDYSFPPGTHAIGRLDKDSEGLLLLTTDKRVTKLLFQSAIPHLRTYLVMVQHQMSDETLDILRSGVSIKIEGGENYLAKPDSVERVGDPHDRYIFSGDHRQAWPHTWLLITLKEGKYRQVRKMVSAVRHRCLRLVRLSITGITIGRLQPGAVMEIDPAEFFTKLEIG